MTTFNLKTFFDIRQGNVGCIEFAILIFAIYALNFGFTDLYEARVISLLTIIGLQAFINYILITLTVKRVRDIGINPWWGILIQSYILLYQAVLIGANHLGLSDEISFNASLICAFSIQPIYLALIVILPLKKKNKEIADP